MVSLDLITAIETKIPKNNWYVATDLTGLNNRILGSEKITFSN